MFRLVAVTFAALYFILLVFGDESRRPAEVARSEPLGLKLVSASVLPADATVSTHTSRVSDREAIEMAIAAGKAIREERRASASETFVALRPETDLQPEPDMTFWYVTGSRVNLRGGPGTANAVVGQVTFGAEAEVLSDQDGWYQIRLADGSAAGWIFGKFLNENLPG